MSEQVVLPSKRRVETVSVTVDFAGQMYAGEVISSAELHITVFAGVDADPEHMLVSPMYITGSKLRHKIQLGVVGVIYQLVFTARLDSGRVLETEARQAILIDAMPADALYQYYYYTSTPYTLETIEGILSSFEPNRAQLFKTPLDGILSSFMPVSGTLRDLLITYDDGKPEGILSGPFLPVSGTLKDILIYYTGKPEGIVSAFEPRSGTLKDVLITYSHYKPEGILSSFAPVSGTLI